MDGNDEPGHAAVHQWDPQVLLEYPLDTIPGALAEVARQFGERVALDADDTHITYAELARRANDIAVAVSERVPDPKASIALILGHGVAPAVLVLGVMCSGRVCVPFDAREPADRLGLMIKDSRAQLVVTVGEHTELARAVAPDLPVLALEAIPPTDEQHPIPQYAPTDPGIVIFTSGSTGAPKGVILGYGQRMVQALQWGLREQMTSSDRVAQLASLSYVVGLQRILVVLAQGATMYAFDLAGRGPRELLTWLRATGITMMSAVPSVIRSMGDLVADDHEPITSVRLVNLFGETVLGTDVQIARRIFGPHVVVANQLGSTEVGGTAQFVVTPEMQPGDGPLPAGSSWAGATVTIVDDHGDPVPDGEPGRIVVASEIIALGYWDDPELTEDSFVSVDGVRSFRTSDLARVRADGLLEHLGRIDSRVKVRGAMVAVGEVETALTSLDDVTEAVVIAIPADDGGNRLVAYVASRAGSAPRPREVRRDVAQLLPSAMVPATVVVLDELPHGTRGKVDRAALPPPPSARPPYREPTGKERELAGLFASVLFLDRVGLDDDFFALGGDSLDALALMAEVNERFGVAMPVSLLLDAPTPALLAPRVGTRRPANASVVVPLYSDGHGAPVFFVAGGGAPALSLHALATHVVGASHDRPFYALQARGLEERAFPDRSVVAMARRNVAAIRAQAPEGPYVLGGYSFGGQVAFDMATRLEADGARVPLLVILDTPPSWEVATTSRVAVGVLAPRQATAKSVRRFAGLAVRNVRRRAQRATAGIVPRPGLTQYELFLDLHGVLARRYRPARTFGGAALVVRLARSGDERDDPGTEPRDLGWSLWVRGPVSVVEMEGEHLDLIRGGSAVELGAHIRNAIAAVETAASRHDEEVAD